MDWVEMIHDSCMVQIVIIQHGSDATGSDNTGWVRCDT